MHQGLTPFGADVIRACHWLGLVCDVAHATADTVKQAVRIATMPNCPAASRRLRSSICTA
jgi:membrane dipeptidase